MSNKSPTKMTVREKGREREKERERERDRINVMSVFT